MTNAQAQLSRTATAAEDFGLVISVPKTEYMTVNCNPQPLLEVYGQPIKHVPNFRYLGSMMASSISDLTRRNAHTWTAFWKLDKIWRSSTISIATKVKKICSRLLRSWMMVMMILTPIGAAILKNAL